jgi:hypothetical protein
LLTKLDVDTEPDDTRLATDNVFVVELNSNPDFSDKTPFAPA